MHMQRGPRGGPPREVTVGVVHCAEFGAVRGGSVCAAVTPIAPRAQEPRARRAGLQIPSKL